MHKVPSWYASKETDVHYYWHVPGTKSRACIGCTRIRQLLCLDSYKYTADNQKCHGRRAEGLKGIMDADDNYGSTKTVTAKNHRTTRTSRLTRPIDQDTKGWHTNRQKGVELETASRNLESGISPPPRRRGRDYQTLPLNFHVD